MVFDGFAFVPFSFQHDDVAATELNVSGGEIAEALVMAQWL